MDAEPVRRLHKELGDAKDFLERRGEISLASAVEDAWRKAVLLAAASNHEARITNLLLRFAAAASNGNSTLTNFVEKKALKRQYHSLFAWDRKNVNQFLGLFGETFKSDFSKLVESSDALRTGIASFLYIGEGRNRLVHDNYAVFSMDETAREVVAKFEEAETFLETLEHALLDESAWTLLAEEE